ncbi:glycosyltransferase [Pedobacter sp. GR22-10]|uniref:glycosyltransferase n=1 Tax=Pedobacter sp. GR22-10 TaxID=2994472 RepID=UPI00224862B7|nr:glycosyltransferase [Pedobacter sp. GR22-10]MCX2431615.1 glycosyltransferase [Pedobacter sp. GR22-10]
MYIINILIFLICLKALVFILLVNRKTSPKKTLRGLSTSYTVEIIIAMYNEEKVIANTLRNISLITSENLKITVVDDGSTDNSHKICKAEFGNDPRISILKQKNNGKASALNRAIKSSTSDILISIDADTLVKPDIIEKILPYFSNCNVAAVSGNIKVANRVNLITYVQHIEYITNPNYERKIFETVNGIMVVPGAIGAFRRSALLQIGGYTNDTLTEDTDITMKILCHGLEIRNAPDVVGYTEAPESAEAFLKQRVRWKVGTIQVLCKYLKEIFNHDNKLLSMIVVPYNWIFGILLPLITPCLDYIALFYLLSGGELTTLKNYVVFLLLDSILCGIILIKNGEPMKFIFLILIQRFLLRQLIFFSYLKIIGKFFSGSIFKWETSVRYGTSKVQD